MQLKAMNWNGSEKCVMCGQPEDASHLLFGCSLAKFVWSFMGETLGWNGYPKSMNDLILNWLPGGFGVGYLGGLACFVGIAWAIWLTKNMMYVAGLFE
jgi:hypothetical protein